MLLTTLWLFLFTVHQAVQQLHHTSQQKDYINYLARLACRHKGKVKQQNKFID